MATDTGVSAAASLGADVNKQKTNTSDDTRLGAVSQNLPELDLAMEDSDIITLTKQWEKDWQDSDARSLWEKQIEENEKYWLGKQFNLPSVLTGEVERPMVDNLIFEAVETYLPQSTRRNPEPLVTLLPKSLDQNGVASPEALSYVEKVKRDLSSLADKNRLRLKLKKAARHWALYQIGVVKYGWDLDYDMPVARVIRPQKMILDPKATIDEDGYTGGRIGEIRKMVASKIIAIIGSEATAAIEKIKAVAKDQLATEVQFIEWWTPDYLCWTLDGTVLLKKKNPHWNYDEEPTPTETVDDYGNVVAVPGEVKKGINHLPVPKMPYDFLSVFNLGDQPMDKTGLIQQNLANQDLINKRNKQITKNADDMNGGMVVSLGRSGLTQAQADNVTKALRKGGVVSIPDGAPRDAIDRFNPSSLPSDVYSQLSDMRNRLRDIFGVKGSSQAGLEGEKLATGKIMSRSLDTDRIGGGVSEYLEQLADSIYNWYLQLLYVYDTEYQFIDGATPPLVDISVKEGSLLPKDSIAIANQALELATLNRISNIDLFKRLEYPNPEEMAANVWLETNAPQLLYKDNPLVQEALQAQALAAEQAAQKEQTIQKDKQSFEMAKENMKMQGKMGEGSPMNMMTGAMGA